MGLGRAKETVDRFGPSAGGHPIGQGSYPFPLMDVGPHMQQPLPTQYAVDAHGNEVILPWGKTYADYPGKYSASPPVRLDIGPGGVFKWTPIGPGVPAPRPFTPLPQTPPSYVLDPGGLTPPPAVSIGPSPYPLTPPLVPSGTNTIYDGGTGYTMPPPYLNASGPAGSGLPFGASPLELGLIGLGLFLLLRK
jgi:hypothetical protein